MKVRMAVALMAAAVGMSALSARADDAAVRKALDAQYAKLIAAMKNKDINGVKAIGTEDFTFKMQGMTRNRKQMEQDLKTQFAMTKSTTSSTMSIDKLVVKGNTAVAMTSGKMSGVVTWKDGKDHVITDTSASKDTWVKTPQGWKIKMVEVISDKMTKDGKPWNPMAEMAPPKKNGMKPPKKKP